MNNQANGSVLTMNSSGWNSTGIPLSLKEKFPDSTRMFTVAVGIIDSVIFFGGRLRVNLHQCKRLVDFYKRAREFFDVLKRREVSVDEQLYNDTLDVLNKGQYLVYGYVEANWLKSMKTAGVNQNAFAKIYVELEDCFRMIFKKIEVGVVVNCYTHDACREYKEQRGSYPPIEFGSLAPLYFLDEDYKAIQFESDAQMDKEHMLEIIKGSGALDNKENMIQRIASTQITIQGLKASLKREQGVNEAPVQKLKDFTEVVDEESFARGIKALAEELLKKKEAEDLLIKRRVKKQVEGLLKKKEVEDLLRKKEAEELLKKKEEELLYLRKTVAEELLKKKQAEDLLKKEHAEDLLKGKEALAKEDLRREQVGKELLKLSLVLQQKEFVQEQREPKEPKGEDLEQENLRVQEVLKHEESNEVKSSSSKETELPQDFKIQSSEIHIGNKIGSGGFASIYKCQWQNHDYAVKMFQAADVDSLRTEMQNLVLLPRHPNIVLLVGFSFSKTFRGTYGSPMLVMELLDGDLHSLVCPVESKKKHQLTDTLSRLWKKLGGQPGLSIPIKIDFIYQIAKGMLFLHKRKVFHGDLKGKNVLVKQHPGNRMQLKITDFGLSEKLIIKCKHNIDLDEDLNCSAFSDHSSLGVRYRIGDGNADGNAEVHGNVGTVRWMAPEVYGVAGGNVKPYSMKADVYSFAMTCVEILTGQHPFPDIRFLKGVKEHVKGGGRPYLWTMKNVPKALLELVERCWDADPLQRPDFSEIYSSMQELKKRFPIN